MKKYIKEELETLQYYIDGGLGEMKEDWSYGELANFTHTKQVEEFNFCFCEEQEYFPYEDCPREEN